MGAVVTKEVHLGRDPSKVCTDPAVGMLKCTFKEHIRWLSKSGAEWGL